MESHVNTKPRSHTDRTSNRLDIGTVVWGPMVAELDFSYALLDDSFAINCAALAVGCILLVPLAIKCGRRPIYLMSSLIQIAAAIWSTKVYTAGDLLGSNVISGIGGAISETIVQMTVADLFFVHQRARMNAVYLAMVNMGSFLAPVAAGYCSNSMGWRWIWWINMILLGVVFVLMAIGYEETKYMPVVSSARRPSMEQTARHPDSSSDDSEKLHQTMTNVSDAPEPAVYRMKSYRQRLSLLKRTPGGSRPFLGLVWDLITLLQFPAVVYTALMWGATLTWFSVILTTLSTYFTLPPYNFSAAGVGLMNLPPFIGSALALVVSGGNDWIIVQLAKRNNGVFEPR
jgi:MFS family permease